MDAKLSPECIYRNADKPNLAKVNDIIYAKIIINMPIKNDSSTINGY